jgi:hypothetical protein
MTTNGLSRSEAQLDICRALSDQKIRIRPTIDPNATEIGSQLVEVPSSIWEKARQRLERQKIVPVPLVPKNLDPQDFDWENSHPKSSWLDTRGCSVGIAKIELYTADVIRVLCRGWTVSASPSTLEPNDVHESSAPRVAAERAATKALARHLNSHPDETKADTKKWLAQQGSSRVSI